VEHSIIQFQKDFFKDPPFGRVFILHGDEDYLIRSFLNKLKETYGEDYTLLWGSETSPEELYESVSEGSLFGGAKGGALVVREFEELLKKVGRKKSAREALIRALSRPKKKNVFLVFERKLQKGELSQEPIKSVLKLGELISANKLPQSRVRQLVKKKLTEAGISADNEVINYLIESQGGELSAIRSEVEKLIHYAGEKGKLTLEEVKRVVFPLSEGGNVFEFVDAVLLGDKERALRTLENLLREGYHPLQIQKLLSSYAIKLYLLRKFLSEGKDKEKALSSLGIRHSFTKMKFKQYLDKNDQERLKKLLSELWRADVAQKLYFQDPQKTIRELTLSLLG